MKNILSILFVAISIVNASAQKVNVEPSSLQTDDGYNAAFTVNIPYASLKTVEKKWTSFLKDNNAKVKSSKSEIEGKNATIKAIGPDTLQIFSKIDEGSRLWAGIPVCPQPRGEDGRHAVPAGQSAGPYLLPSHQ